MYRIGKHEKKYKQIRQHQDRCPFCEPNKAEIIKKTVFFYIIKNVYGYDLWDRRQVEKHLMIVSKTHMVSLDKINQRAIVEYFRLLQKYSQQGYDVFTRSTLSGTKTQLHFHTHLIKTGQQIFNHIRFVSEPYELFFE